MKIRDERKKIPFNNIDVGDWFAYQNSYYMKIEPTDSKHGVRNAVSAYGQLFYFDNKMVEHVNLVGVIE